MHAIDTVVGALVVIIAAVCQELELRQPGSLAAARCLNQSDAAVNTDILVYEPRPVQPCARKHLACGRGD